MSGRGDRPVALVTGGGGGIGAAIALELGRRGAHVVTVDPLVTVDGSGAAERTDAPTTAEQIVAAGGSARASAVSVTDRKALRRLAGELIEERGRIDAVVNVAGITRPTRFASGTEEDWAAVLAVHLDGYRNVLDAVLPHMVEAGSGRVVGVTSGSGWRAADAGAYSCAKRAVASLTWQLGAAVPPGVSVNAISPIAMTRMVAAAMARAKAAAPRQAESSAPSARRATGGLALGGMPPPEALGPLGAHLASVDGTTLRGRVLFAGGSEVAPIRPPGLLEVVRTPEPAAAVKVLEAVLDTWVAVEATQATGGGANPRFPSLYEPNDPGEAVGSATGQRVLVIGEDALGELTVRRLEDRGATVVVGRARADGVAGARDLVERAAAQLGGLDALIVEAVEPRKSAEHPDWSEILADHGGLAGRILEDARWARAAADHTASSGQPLRLVTLVDAATPAGRSRAQAAAQLARAGHGATAGLVAAVAVAIESRGERPAATALAALLALDPRAAGLAGAELAVGPGWVGLRSHPTPAGSLVFGGPELPEWFDAAVTEMAGGPPA